LLARLLHKEPGKDPKMKDRKMLKNVEKKGGFSVYYIHIYVMRKGLKLFPFSKQIFRCKYDCIFYQFDDLLNRIKILRRKKILRS